MLLSNIWKIWNVATQNTVFKTSQLSWGVRAWEGKWESKFYCYFYQVDYFSFSKSSWKKYPWFYIFLAEACTLVYETVQLWNIQCSLLCVWWSFSSSLLSQHSLCRLQCITSPWLLGFFDMSWDVLKKFSSSYCSSTAFWNTKFLQSEVWEQYLGH